MDNVEMMVQLPFHQPNDLADLEAFVRLEDLLINGKSLDGDTYSVRAYLQSIHMEGQKYHALFDRNLLSPIAELMRGRQLPENEGTAKVWRASCACLAFCIVADILVEPSMALYEYGSGKCHDDVLRDYRCFRLADNSNAAFLANIALGRSNRIPGEHLDELSNASEIDMSAEEGNFSKTLNVFNLQYLLTLKAAQYLKSESSNVVAAEKLIDWQSREGYFNAVATIFLWLALSHSPPKGGMLKSADTAKGLKNAAWDMSLISEWGKKSTREPQIKWLLCSNDIAVRHVANSLFVRKGESELEVFRSTLVEHWGPRDGNRLLRRYQDAVGSAGLHTDERSRRVQRLYANLEQEIQQLEAEVTC